MLPVQVSRFIDLARWVAACAVLVTHVGNLFINQSDIMVAPHGPGMYVWWFLQGFSHQAVVVFFVISGFLVGGSVIEKSRRSGAFLPKYLIDRVVRIYIVLVPVLVIGLVLDTFGRSTFGSDGVYGHPGYAGVFDPRLLLPNLLNLQGTYFRAYGTNGPLWSLGMEFWYYIVCPLLLAPLMPVSLRAKIAGFVAGAALFVAFGLSPSFFLVGALIWGAGALVRVVPRPLLRSKWLSLVMFVAVTVFIRLAINGKLLTMPAVTNAADLAVGLTFANLLLTLRFTPSAEWAVTRWRIHRHLSDFSYSLYACHLPILVFAAACFDFWLGAGWHSHMPTPMHWVATFGLIGGVLAFAWALSRLTEARTAGVRAALYRLIADRGARPAPLPVIGQEPAEGVV